MVCGKTRSRIWLATFPTVVRPPLVHIVWVLLIEIIFEDFGLIEVKLFLGLGYHGQSTDDRRAEAKS